MWLWLIKFVLIQHSLHVCSVGIIGPRSALHHDFDAAGFHSLWQQAQAEIAKVERTYKLSLQIPCQTTEMGPTKANQCVFRSYDPKALFKKHLWVVSPAIRKFALNPVVLDAVRQVLHVIGLSNRMFRMLGEDKGAWRAQERGCDSDWASLPC